MNQQGNQNGQANGNGHVNVPNEQGNNGCRPFLTGRFRIDDQVLHYYFHGPFVWHQMPGGLNPRFFTCYPAPDNAEDLLKAFLRFEVNPNMLEYFDGSGKRKCPIGGFLECEDHENEDQIRDHIMLVHFNRGFKCKGFNGRGCRFLAYDIDEIKTHLMVAHRMRMGSFDFHAEIEAINDVFDLAFPNFPNIP